MKQYEPFGEMEQKGQSEQRRRLLVGSLAGGLIATMKTGNALAEGVCASPSAFTSVTLNPATSRRPRNLPICHSHGYWKRHYSGETTVSGAGFCCDSLVLAGLGITCNTKLKVVLALQGKGEDGALARDLVAAYLDAANGFSQGQFDVSDIRQMWALVFCGVPYVVNGTAWRKETVRAFLDVLVGNTRNWP